MEFLAGLPNDILVYVLVVVIIILFYYLREVSNRLTKSIDRLTTLLDRYDDSLDHINHRVTRVETKVDILLTPKESNRYSMNERSSDNTRA